MAQFNEILMMGELTDLVFSLIGKLGRWFNVEGKRICFLLWGACMLYWTFRNFQLGLVVQTCSCLATFLMDMYGYWNWRRKGIDRSSVFPEIHKERAKIEEPSSSSTSL